MNICSIVSVKTSPTHYFINTSIALAALDVKQDDLLNDMNSFGMFFKIFTIKDLSIYVQTNRAILKHYWDNNGNEVDAIVEFPDGKYGIVEIKITSEDI